MFRDSGANSSFSLVDFSQIGKYTYLGQILYSNTNIVRFCNYKTSLRDLEKYLQQKVKKIAWLDIALAPPSRSIFDAAPCRE